MYARIRDLISRHIGYSIVDRKGGFNKLSFGHMQEQKDISNFTNREISDYQLKKLKVLLEHAESHVPYYRNIFKELAITVNDVTCLDDLNIIPVLTKKQLIENKNELVSDFYTTEELVSNASGGSTGMTVNFFQDKNYTSKQVGSAYYFDSIAGWRKGGRTAYLWGASNDIGNKLSVRQRLRQYLLNTETYDSFDMSDDMMWKYHCDLKMYCPDVMVCYAGSIYEFSKYLKRNGIKPDYPKYGIITSAETLSIGMRETIEAVFPVKIFNRYGSREVGLISSECGKNHEMHVNWADVIVEIDSDTGSEKQGRILVTNLNNFATPFIRYEIGDVGVISTSTSCACGRNGPRIKELTGRTTDMFKTKDGKVIHGEYFTHIFYGLNGVKQFQFVQNDYLNYDLYIIKNTSLWKNEDEDYISNKIKNALGKDINIEFKYCESIPLTPSGKFRFTISKLWS